MQLLKLTLVTAFSLTTIACASSDPDSFASECGYFELQGDKPLTFTMNSPTEATLDGVICSGSLDAFNHLTARFPDIRKLNIDVIEGSADDEVNLQLSRRIHDKRMSTHLNSDGMIASGGVDLFLSGVERSADDVKPRIGVHSWSTSDDMEGNRIPKSHPLHEEYLSYYRYIDIDSGFYWFTLDAASAEDIHWMNAAEIEKYQVIN
ncbi:alpha/beta hydrolase [Vibrio sp. JC009]|uniref:alpha/beta hydrolase n=1 Tax=Vibrio sp. JC009 TaxID=2912314 RepID=UPI0023AE7FEA|nr:alpha/beta hydrolase [Vibrio sp. JC009]WED23629.1 alpha/beta hydrolase [Vibrio sp. JC009]